ncbi:9561db44-f022-46d9-829f-60848b735ce3 [Thermothielavioides terrestris]|uniref:9561db44-f022-46d9-829f-60848b735ce3 n=1 Tax=Thermothielavioides terrestris TaxID=2587410 RepID=A0A3S4BQ18_9PEZI|nr:9561db44-f022-46d9-829f-60848b735ce3 [Thermothielavioides terrestris]
MSDFDTYCAICGGPLNEVKIGSTAPSHLRRRREIVARKRDALKRIDSHDGRGSQRKDKEDDVHDEEHEESAEGEEEWFAGHEGKSYDPGLISRQGLAWLQEICCLGLNLEVNGESNFRNYLRNSDNPAFPFHHGCLDILTQVLTGSTDAANLNKDALYDAMSGLHDVSKKWPIGQCLNLDYGNVEGRDRRWRSIPGEEFSVTDPAPTAELAKTLRRCIIEHGFGIGPDSLGSVIPRQPQVRDPFSRLPVEILQYIFRFLPGHDLLAVLKASWIAFLATRSNQFWKRFLKQDMPWLTELWPLLEDYTQGGDHELNYRAQYLWLDHATLPRYGLDGPFLALANRRRIWGVCEQLALPYFRHLHAKPLGEPDSRMVEATFCRHMAIESDNKPGCDPSASRKTFFAHSVDELDSWPMNLEFFWGKNHRLVGLCAIICKQRRVFGLDGEVNPDVTKSALRITAGLRITEIQLFIETADPNKSPTASPGIVSLKVITSVVLCMLDRFYPDWETRLGVFTALTVSPGARSGDQG